VQLDVSEIIITPRTTDMVQYLSEKCPCVKNWQANKTVTFRGQYVMGTEPHLLACHTEEWAGLCLHLASFWFLCRPLRFSMIPHPLFMTRQVPAGDLQWQGLARH
jgi:hypothetical protein